MMAKRCFHLFLILVVSRILATPRINIVYPPEGETLQATAIDSNYIFGQVTPPTAQLFINHTAIPVYPNGAFLAFLPLQSGQFVYNCRLIAGKDTVQVRRHIFVPSPPHVPPSDSLVIKGETVEPGVDHILSAGDCVQISFWGTPLGQAFFTIGSSSERHPLIENVPAGDVYWGEAVFGTGAAWKSPSAAGFYSGSYTFKSSDHFDQDSIYVYLQSPQNELAKSAAKGRLSTWSSEPGQWGETWLPKTVLRTAQGKSYYYFLPPRVVCRLTGQIGHAVRIQLSERVEAWTEKDKIVHIAPVDRMPITVRVLRCESNEIGSRVKVFTSMRVPFRIEQSIDDQALHVYFYGVIADTDWIRYQQKDDQIAQIRWRQVDRHIYVLDIYLNQKQQWGYRADYDQDDCFFIDIKRPPRKQNRSLKNVVVLLDPGHAPDTGAVGPTGLYERQANLELAKKVAEFLINNGAIVQWTRRGDGGISLADRVQLADTSRADVLLSIHHNAIPEGVNPFKSRGSSVYYYHPQSLAMARRIHQQLLHELKLPDFGIYWDNLAMCRPTNMPALLLEPAFMMHPEEEMLIRSSQYRKNCARAIVKGLKRYFHEFRE